jgi:hypothetical protein
MAPATQAAPEPRRTSYVYSTSTGDGGGTGSPPDRLAIRLASDGRYRNKLHVMILVLPVSILIFIEALRHPKDKIKLPIIGLDLEINSLLPLLLLVICYLLYRAIRYSRRLLVNILVLPSQVAEIAFDSKEAFKVDTAYDEVVDEMLIDFLDHENRFVRAVARFVFTGSNVFMSAAIYGLIFVILVYAALFVTSEIPTVLASNQFDPFKPRWPSDPSLALNLLLLGLCAFLLGLAWINAGIVLIVVSLGLLALILVIVVGGLFAIGRLVRAIYRSRFFLPLKWIFGAAMASVLWLRERSREKRFRIEEARYDELVQEFKKSPAFVGYVERLQMYSKLSEERPRLVLINRVIREDARPRYSYETDWWPLMKRSGLNAVEACVDLLAGLLQHAPLDQVKAQYERLKPIVDAFSPDETLLDASRHWETLDSVEKEKSVADLRKWLTAMPSREIELDSMQIELQAAIKGLDQEGRAISRVYFGDHWDEASKYFARPSLENAGLSTAKPIRGSHDWRAVTYLIDILGRLGGTAVVGKDAGGATVDEILAKYGSSGR